MTKLRRTYLFCIFSYILISSSFACQEHLIIDSHNQPNVEEYRKRFEEVHTIAKSLGLIDGVKNHVVELLNPSAVAGLASLNRYPVGSWSDGAKIFTQAKHLQGVLEFVLSGHYTQHSYYLSNLSPIIFMNILAHVYGHNFFHVSSYFKHKTSHDRVGISLELDELMQDVSKEVDPREVEDWFFHLLSLEMAQDVWSANYVQPEDFAISNASNYKSWRDDLEQPSHRAKQTVSLLQAFVHEIPKDAPLWKREMARKFEKMNRYIPGAVNTKLLNEGFAMLVEEIIFAHHPESARGFGDAAEIGMLAGRVAYPSLSNPYYLGLEIWREIREEFNAQPQNISLSLFDRDKKFISYAKEIIGNPNLGNNIMFIFSKLSDRWVKNKHIALVKKFSEEEKFELVTQGAPLPPNVYDGTLYQVITHDPERIRFRLQQDWNLSFSMPRVEWKNLHQESEDIARFNVSYKMGYFTPINRKHLAPTMLSWAKVLRKNVELEATLILDVVRGVDWTNWRKPKHKIIGYRLARVSVRVNPQGQISVSTIKKIEVMDRSESWNEEDEEGYSLKPAYFKEWVPTSSEKAQSDKELREILAKNLKVFLDDFNIDNINQSKGVVVPYKDSPGEAFDPKKALFKSINDTVASMALNDVPHGIIKALSRYHQKVSERFLAAFHAALNNGGLTRNSHGYNLKVLPDIGGIVFDRRAQNGLRRLLSRLTNVQNNPYKADDGLLLIPIGLRDKEYFVQQASSDQGEDGNGDGEDDGEQDEGSDEDEGNSGNESNGSGCGGGDPSYIEIPLELYQNLIKDEIELPNLRPLDGQSERVRKVFVGSQAVDRRPYVARRIVKDAIKLGAGLLSLKEENSEDVGDLDPYEVGLDLLQKKNIYSKATRIQPDPDISAQVTIISDLSGSMDSYISQMKEIIFNIRSLLKHKYKSIIFNYVAFDGVAYAFDEKHENDFYKVQLGGGTDYGVGAQKALEVQKNFPDSKYDRFTFLFGDLIAPLSPEAKNSIDELMKNSRFLGTVNFTDYSEGDELGQFLIEKSKSDPFVGYALIPDGVKNVNVVHLLRKLFKTEGKKKN